MTIKEIVLALLFTWLLVYINQIVIFIVGIIITLGIIYAVWMYELIPTINDWKARHANREK